MGRKKNRPRRTFTPEFKAEAVALVLDRGLTQSKVARDLDVTRSALRRWIKEEEARREAPPEQRLSTGERSELDRLRRENRILREEREILKKPRRTHTVAATPAAV